MKHLYIKTGSNLPVNAYLHMLLHSQKQLKTFANGPKSTFLSFAQEAHARLVQKNKGKSLLVNNWECLSMGVDTPKRVNPGNFNIFDHFSI